ncbi:hypothetical protein HDU76_006951, partial [Blyttiomyces sp. JEL0837]
FGPMTPFWSPAIMGTTGRQNYSALPPPSGSMVPLDSVGRIPSFTQQFHWATETQPDEHARMLLSHHFGGARSDHDDVMVFAHWHTDGDNYFGNVENVKFEIRYPGVIKRIMYDVSFNDPTATLDDVFSGEGTVTLRNDMDLPHMHLNGRILRLEIHQKGAPAVAFGNGDLPSRYKSAFHLRREDKITDFWKNPLTRVNITYSPPHQAAVLHLRAGQHIDRLRIDFFPASNVERARVYVKRVDGGDGNMSEPKNQNHNRKTRKFSYDQQQELFFMGGIAVAGPDADYDGEHGNNQGKAVVAASPTGHAPVSPLAPSEPLGYLREVIGGRPVPTDSWRVIAHALWPDNSVPGSNANAAAISAAGAGRNMFGFGNSGGARAGAGGIGSPGGGGVVGVGVGGVGDVVSVTLDAGSGTEAVVMEASPVTVVVEERWEGPATYVLLCDETRVAYQGVIEEEVGTA